MVAVNICFKAQMQHPHLFMEISRDFSHTSRCELHFQLSKSFPNAPLKKMKHLSYFMQMLVMHAAPLTVMNYVLGKADQNLHNAHLHLHTHCEVATCDQKNVEE